MIGGRPSLVSNHTVRHRIGRRGAPSAYRDAVLLNAAAALVVADAASDLKTGVELARESIDSGAARDRIRKVAAVSQQK